jgi:TetR/AcrR family transcriptional regulator, transcriptional repressor for nem operon
MRGKGTMTRTGVPHESRIRLLDAALKVVREKGYTAARVEDVCRAAGVTKGSFFHHFASKEDLALAAAAHWSEVTSALFAAAAYHDLADPLDRLLAYIDFRKALVRGELHEFTCFAGSMVQDVYDTDPAIRDACDRSISGHAATLEADIEAAMRRYRVAGDWSAASLALYIQAALQGAFVLAKAKHGADVAIACLDHLRRHVELLFRHHQPEEEP